MTLMLEGNIDNRDELIRQLQEQVQELQRDLIAAKNEARQARAESARAVGALRRQLTPLYQALQAVFGEMDAVAGSEAVTEAAPAGGAKWEFWKKRFGGRIAETIDLLLVQGEMNATQLCHALRCDSRTLAKAVIYQLNKAGLLNKNGGRFSLKQL